VAESLTDYAKIDQVGGAIFQRWKKLDILVGCAGSLGQLSPMQSYTPKMWDEVFAVNVTANWRLIRAMDPLLRESDAGRAIFVTSAAGRRAGMYWGPYAASKAALDNMVLTYAAENRAHKNAREPARPGPRTHQDARRGLSRRGPDGSDAA